MNESLQHLGPESKGTGSSQSPTIELNSILAPIDFSLTSRHGLAFAAAVATRFRSQIHIVYVAEPPSLPQWGYAHLPIREAKLRRAAGERLPQFVVESGIDPTLVRSTTVRSGGADLEICEAAVERKADLIVIASHGLGGVKHALIGSTAERVVRHAPCPVLTVRDRAFATEKTEQPFFAPRRILVTTDFSEASKAALPYAAALARNFEASLTLVHVVPSHLPAQLSHIGIIFEEERMLAAARERLPRFREAELDPHVHVESLVLHGGAVHEICAAANRQHADLIVISTHGYTGLNRFTLGSVTENVVRHAPCAVLVVREREHEFLKT
jgi:nucleotide-binding universal stress UspA family protein